MSNITSLFHSLDSRWQAYNLRRQLTAFSDRTLNDIGIERYQIDSIARHASRQPRRG